jgi:hypothetical protein
MEINSSPNDGTIRTREKGSALPRLDHEPENGLRVAATERTGGHRLSVEYGHRMFKHRKGSLEHHTGQGNLWLGQHSPDLD